MRRQVNSRKASKFRIENNPLSNKKMFCFKYLKIFLLKNGKTSPDTLLTCFYMALRKSKASELKRDKSVKICVLKIVIPRKYFNYPRSYEEFVFLVLISNVLLCAQGSAHHKT